MQLLGRLRRKRLLPIALLTSAVLIVPLVVAMSGRTYAGVDLPTSYYPHIEVLRREARESGRLPLWDFHEFGGTPFLGNLVDGVFYPPNLLFHLLPTCGAFELLVALHLGLAAFGMYRLTRSYRLPRGACTLAGCAFTLSMTLIVRVGAGHYGAFLTIAFAPLLLLLVRNVVRVAALQPALLLALVAAMLALGGHPPFVYQLGLVAAAFAVAELVAIRSDRGRVFRAAGLLAGAGVLAVCLDAVLLLPALEVRAHASRGGLVAAELPAERNPDRSWLPEDAASFWIPFYPRSRNLRDGNWVTYFRHEKAVYVGLLPLICAAAAFLAPKRRGPVLFFALLGVLALAEAMARHLPVHRLATAVLPGYQSFRVPARSVWIAALSICVLAAFGLGRWSSLAPLVQKRFLAGAAGVAALVAIVLALRFGVQVELGLFLVLVGAAVGILRRAGSRPAAVLAASMLTILELGIQAATFVPTAPVPAMLPVPWYRAHLGEDPSATRVLDAGSLWSGYAPAASGIRLMDGAGYPMLDRTRRYYAAAWTPPPEAGFDEMGVGKSLADPSRLDRFNVGWLLWVGPPPESGLVEVARQGDTVLYRRPTALPYARAGASPMKARRGANEVRVESSATGPETLVVSESWMPGWKVEVDGRAADVVAHDGVFLSVAVPAGARDVRFFYSPDPYRHGRVISLAALLATLAALLLSLLRRPTSGGAVGLGGSVS